MNRKSMQNELARRDFLKFSLIASGLAAAGCAAPRREVIPQKAAASASKPNIVVILADDLGYGDLGCYGATKVKTPNIDRIAREGMLFTDAHAPAATCMPSRYGLLTGRYFWRVPGNFSHVGLSIEEDRATLGSILQDEGYATACIGKWHLQFGTGPEPVDWNKELKPGPLEVGFDYYFGTPVSHNEQPQVLVENRHVLGLDPADPIKVRRQQEGEGDIHGKTMGGVSARFNPEELATKNVTKALEFIDHNHDQPFFLYLAMNNVHGPLTPAPRFKGSSELGVYGDFIQELDWAVGEVLSKLDSLQVADNTLVIFTSDNGAMLYSELHQAGHRANGDLIGQKTDVWEGGHRVPFIARWPKHITAGARSEELVSLNDIFATTAALIGRTTKEDEGPDSCNILPMLLGQPHDAPVRQDLILLGTHDVAVREGNWLLIKRPGSGGFTTELNVPSWMSMAQLKFNNSDYTEQGERKQNAPAGQLYDLEKDPNQTHNLYNQHPEIVERLTTRLREIEGTDSAEACALECGRALNAAIARINPKTSE